MAQPDKFLDRGNYAFSQASQDRGARCHDLSGVQQLRHSRQQTTLLSILSVGSREENPHDMATGLKEPVGRIEQRAKKGAHLPGQRDISVILLDRHQWKRDF